MTAPAPSADAARNAAREAAYHAVVQAVAVLSPHLRAAQDKDPELYRALQEAVAAVSLATTVAARA